MIRWMLGWMLDGSWIDFFSILGSFWEASWHQVGTKIQKKRVPKRYQKMNGKKFMQQKRSRRGAAKEMGSGPLKAFKNTLGNPMETSKTQNVTPLSWRCGGYTYKNIYIYI